MASTVFQTLTLPNVALPIARGQRGCLTKNPQSARPLIRGHEGEANGTNQDKRGDHRQTLFPPATMPQPRPFDYGPKIQTNALPGCLYCIPMRRMVHQG
jgi:hypothetical protein